MFYNLSLGEWSLPNKVVALITSAGSGLRLGLPYNKVFYQYKNKFLLEYTLDVFQKSPLINAIVVILDSENKNKFGDRLKKKYKKILGIVQGGKERQDSVRQGLNYLRELEFDDSVVFIHDGARPFVSSEFFEKLFASTKPKQGAVLGIDVRDTIKKIQNSFVVDTLDRKNLFQIQTPQSFLLKEICLAYEKNQGLVTDDAQIFENWGGEVTVVKSNRLNFKITYPDDLELFKLLINQKRNS